MRSIYESTLRMTYIVLNSFILVTTDYRPHLFVHQLMEGEKGLQGLRSELRDQEELINKMAALQQENSALAHQLQMVSTLSSV